MEFKNEIDRWRQIREFAEYIMKYADFREGVAIRECVHYEWDNQSAEEYCWCPDREDPEYPGRSVGLNGESQKICWKCPHYKIRSSRDTQDKLDEISTIWGQLKEDYARGFFSTDKEELKTLISNLDKMDGVILSVPRIEGDRLETGDPRTCPKFQSIFICKYCEFDSKCGEIINNMTGEEIKELYEFLRGDRVK